MQKIKITYYANNKTYEMVDLSKFKENNIDIVAQNFNQTKYIQKYKNQNLQWLSNLSWIDFIFNAGDSNWN